MTDSNLAEPDAKPSSAVPEVAALGVDLLLVAVFVLLGRTSHHKEHLVAGWAGAAWPFLSGTLFAWALVLLLRRAGKRLPGGSFVAGAVVVTGTVVVGMSLRRLFTDGGTPVSFLIVATAFLSILLFGWRGLDRLRRSRRA